jgi:hypothetical protein
MAVTQTTDGGADTGSRPGRRRRTATILGVAAACAAAIAAPFALGGGGGVAPAPAAPSSPAAPHLPKGTMVGDVDADGTPDVVRLSRGGMLRVDLGSGRTVRRLLPDDAVLEGLARIDDEGLVIVTSTRVGDVTAGRDWEIRRVTDGRLARVSFANGLSMGYQPRLETAWIGPDLLLRDGALDVLQHGADHVGVLARTWTLRGGRVTPSPSGVWCWDRAVSTSPAPCASGQDWRYDVGPRGDLPALLPALGRREAGPAGITTGDGYTWRLHPGDPPGPPEYAHVDLVVDGPGTTQSVPVPPGWAPGMFARPVRVGDLTDGVLVTQEGGDSTTWRIYVRWAGLAQPLRTRGPVPLGGGFTTSGSTAYLSWVAADGRFYTRVGLPRPGRYRVYAWTPTGATASTAPVLEARDLGVVCLDETWETYGTCPS